MYLLKHTLTPAISATILIAITIAATIPTTSSTGPTSFYLSKNEELQITGCVWAPDSSYANVTVSNFGDCAVSVSEVQLDGAAVEHVFVSGDSVVDVGESVMVQVFGCFLGNVSYEFGVVTCGGAEFVCVAAAPEPSATFLVDSGDLEDAADEVTKVVLDENVSDNGSETGEQSSDSAEEEFESYGDASETVVGQVYSGVDPAYFYSQDVQTQQYLADVAARKALLLEGEAGLNWELVEVHVTFIVRNSGDCWEALNENNQTVVFGGSTGAGGVNGCDGGVVLNAAIAAASAAGGGRVVVGCGVLFADSIVPKSCVDVCGEGEASVLRQNADANTIFIHSGEQITNFSMHDLTIDYNHQSQSSPKEGMYIGHASEFLHFYNLWIRNCKKFGIHLAALNQPSDYPISCKNVKVENIIFMDVVAENWDLCVVASHGGCIRNVTILGMHRNGGIVAFEGSNLLITDCHVTIDGQDGEIVGGIWLGSCTYSLCANNTVIGQTMFGDYETIGIRVNTEHDNMMPRDSYRNMVTGNSVSTIRHGIMLEETMDDYVAFNTLTDCANGIAFPDYGSPAAIEPKIFFNALFNVANYIQEFMAPVGRVDYWNGNPASFVP